MNLFFSKLAVIYLIVSSKLEMDFNTEIANCKVDNLDNLFKEIYKRLIIPFYVPLLMLIPLLLITSSKEKSGINEIVNFIEESLKEYKI